MNTLAVLTTPSVLSLNRVKTEARPQRGFDPICARSPSGNRRSRAESDLSTRTALVGRFFFVELWLDPSHNARRHIIDADRHDEAQLTGATSASEAMLLAKDARATKMTQSGH